MEILGLTTGLLLPWILGIVWLRVRWLNASDFSWPILLGYGYLAGALATTLVIRLLDVAGVRLGFVSISAALLVLIVSGIWAGRGTALRRPNMEAEWQALDPGWQRIAYSVLLALILVRLVGLGFEIVWRPLFPWDAWSQWATKARVWYELGHLVPFVSGDLWLAGGIPNAYTDTAPHYPPAIPLLQMWMCFSLGRWDDALMNLPWLQCAFGLGLAFYGQARRWLVPPLSAMVFTYFLLSLPMLNSHLALAGYADVFMGAYFGLAAMAFFHWIRTRDRWQGVVAIFFALGCTFIKQPGIVWTLIFVPALWIAVSPRAGWTGVAALVTVCAVGFLIPGLVGRIELFGYVLHGWHYASAWEPLRLNLLVLDNWHLLWYMTFAILLVALPRLLSATLRGMTVLVFAAFTFLGIVFFLTPVQAWADDFTTLNRAYLHMVPMLLFYHMILLREEVRLPNWIPIRWGRAAGISKA